MNPRLDELIMQSFAKAPTEPCLWWRGTWWSRGAIDELVVECEERLLKSGFSRGQRLGLVLPNSPIMLASCIAAWRIGGAVVPVNPNLKSPPVPEYLKSVDVFGAIVSREVEGLVDFIADAGIPVAPAALNDAAPVIDGRTAAPDTGSDIAVLFHTAGASGDVKAVPITHNNILTLLSSILEMIPSMDEDDVILNAIPNHHSFGFVVAGIMPIASGMPQVIIPSVVPPKTTLSAIRSTGVTIIPTLPLMLGILLGGERDIAPMSKVKLVFYGGGELMPGVAAKAKEVFGVEPLEGYGLTEASSVLAFTPAEDSIKPGVSGKILSCFDAEVRDINGNLQPYNEDGVLWIHGDAVAGGYYRAEAISAERFRDGWFDTQDIVRIDEDGYITIVSPAGDVIMVGGVPVYPGEIETILKGHPEISEVAVVGMPRGLKGEYVRACVVLKEGSTLKPRDIVMYGRGKLPNYKAPRSIRILPELPKNNLGKILKKELRGV
ncbi:MAG: AMP-binding protein [Synergistaceae bacterium]|jgi:long-chain acyl-CoA synthetase|nr:AMP-binding protein [Synergistaceae bacterium]